MLPVRGWRARADGDGTLAAAQIDDDGLRGGFGEAGNCVPFSRPSRGSRVCASTLTGGNHVDRSNHRHHHRRHRRGGCRRGRLCAAAADAHTAPVRTRVRPAGQGDRLPGRPTPSSPRGSGGWTRWTSIPLSAEQQARYSGDWAVVQEQFVDTPGRGGNRGAHADLGRHARPRLPGRRQERQRRGAVRPPRPLPRGLPAGPGPPYRVGDHRAAQGSPDPLPRAVRRPDRPAGKPGSAWSRRDRAARVNDRVVDSNSSRIAE